MGACCGGQTKADKSVNLMSKKTGDMDLKGIPILTVIKAQALMRGFLARRRVKKVYGYEMSRGLMMRGTIHIEMDPQKLEAQRARVQRIREQLVTQREGPSNIEMLRELAEFDQKLQMQV